MLEKARQHLTALGSRGFTWFPILLLILALYLGFLVVRPFMDTIILAIVLAALSFPIYARLERRFGGKRSLAALLVVMAVVFFILIPVLFIASGIIAQGVESLAKLNTWIRTTDFDQLMAHYELDSWVSWLDHKFPFLKVAELDIPATAIRASQQFGQVLLRVSTSFIGDVATILLHFGLMIVILFYLLRDGRAMVNRLMYLLPMREEQSAAIIAALRNVSRAVLMGGLLIALLQGIVGGIGLALVGIPALFWGTMLGFASLVPVVGTSLVWVPAALYLLLFDSWQHAAILSAWCLVIVVNIDTFVRPYLMKDAAGVPIVMVFVAVLGGIKAFGPIGLLYGPLIVTFVMAMIEIYSINYREMLESRHTDEGQQPVVDE